jgi:hypothetical protein
MEADSLTTERDKKITCVSCLAQNGPFDTFCHECGAPIGRTATLDPIQTIQTEGFLFRKALEGRPKVTVLMGVWILHLPVLLGGVGGAIYIIRYQRGLAAFVFFWALVALSCFAFIVLYRITKNYLTLPKVTRD